MKFKHIRKPRGTKLNGEPSYNLCSCCYSPYCDPMARHPRVEQRLINGLCPACGKPWDLCRCNSHNGANTIMTHNNKKDAAYCQRRNDLINLVSAICKDDIETKFYLEREIRRLRVKQSESVASCLNTIKTHIKNTDAKTTLTNAVLRHVKLTTKG